MRSVRTHRGSWMSLGLLVAALLLANMAVAQMPESSDEMKQFRENSRQLTDAARGLDTCVSEQVGNVGTSVTTVQAQEFVQAVKRLRAGAEVCERRLDDSNDRMLINRGILSVFVRMRQVSETSSSVQLDGLCAAQLLQASEVAAQMEAAYIKRMEQQPNPEISGKLLPEVNPDRLRVARRVALNYLEDEYALAAEAVTIDDISQLGVYHRVAARARGREYRVLVDLRNETVAFERHFIKP